MKNSLETYKHKHMEYLSNYEHSVDTFNSMYKAHKYYNKIGGTNNISHLFNTQHKFK